MWLDLLKLPSKQLLQAILATPHITKVPKINTPFHWEGRVKSNGTLHEWELFPEYSPAGQHHFLPDDSSGVWGDLIVPLHLHPLHTGIGVGQTLVIY